MDAFEEENQVLFSHGLAFGQWLGGRMIKVERNKASCFPKDDQTRPCGREKMG
jgi:hypothetical protein